MTQTHPITPPDELVRQWRDRWHHAHGEFSVYIATQAAQWGADQELEACVALVNDWAQRLGYPHYGAELRAARRPKSPSLKEQALAELEEIMTELHDETGSAFTASAIRRALESLPND
jgi:hypothetical protein